MAGQERISPTAKPGRPHQSPRSQPKAPGRATDNTRVSNVATISDNSLSVAPDTRSSGRLTFALGVILCGVALIISVQWYSEAARNLTKLNQSQAAAASTATTAAQGETGASATAVLQEANTIFKQMSRAGAAGVAGAFVLIVVSVGFWQQRS